MHSSGSEEISRVAVIGSGTIGASWAALFMSSGIDVIATDLSPAAEGPLRKNVAQCLRTLQSSGTKGDAGKLVFTTDLAAACDRADFIQESTTEREGDKVSLVTRIDAMARPTIVIASSSSAIPITQIQRDCRRPERVVLGHPFNPAHLVPLVEVVGGERTADWALRKAEAFYRALGKVPVRLRREAFGHVANRLQAAIFREAIHLLITGVASVEEIDMVVTEGPGVRWSLMGPFLTYHLAGGPKGIMGFMMQFADMQRTLWQDLGAPEFNEQLMEQVSSVVGQAFQMRPVAGIANERDRRIAAVLAARREAKGGEYLES